VNLPRRQTTHCELERFSLPRTYANATSKCEIVTRNPVVIGDIWLEDGPYGSLNDTKLPRSTIGACPKDDRRAG
jgi:hypothetical protein